MKSLRVLCQLVLIDLGTRCGTSTTRDLKTISSRLEHEGLSFLTITLATFGRDFEKSLDQGFVGHDQFLGFSRTGGLPRFMGGFLDHVFSRTSGQLLDEPSIAAIIAIRQFSLMWAKISIPCTNARREAAIDKFVECEEEVRLNDRRILGEPSRLSSYSRIGRLLWAEFFCAVDNEIYSTSLIPKHGPGATADRLAGNSKFMQQLWTQRLEQVFPHWEHLVSSPSFLDRLDDVTILSPEQELPVRVITVPKTQKTPRIIAVEPTCMQYMQQAVLQLLKVQTRRFDNTSSFVMSDSQEPNQRLAKEGSITGNLATLDLSEASDRVSYQLVLLLLENHPHLREAVDSTRSRKADVPGYGVVRLAKFASMGSALCFPFEAIVFATIVFTGIERSLNRPLTVKDIQSFRGKVRVYGDDIIVPVEHVQGVKEALEAFGLVVNSSKSFWTGKFRESCGKDYYDGHDVSIVRVRSELPDHRQHVDKRMSKTVSLRNQLFYAGFEKAVRYLDNKIEKLIPFPVVEPTSVILGRHSYSPCQAERFDRDLHIPLVKGVVVTSQLPKSNLEDYGALMKYFISKPDDPQQDLVGAIHPSLLDGHQFDKEHLYRAGRPRSVRIKTRWARPY